MDMVLGLVAYEGPDLNGMMFEVSEDVETIQIGNPILNLYKFEARRGSGQAGERPSTHCSPSGGMTLYFSEGGLGGSSTKLSPCAAITNLRSTSTPDACGSESR